MRNEIEIDISSCDPEDLVLAILISKVRLSLN